MHEMAAQRMWSMNCPANAVVVITLSPHSLEFAPAVWRGRGQASATKLATLTTWYLRCVELRSCEDDNTWLWQDHVSVFDAG